MAAPNAVSQNPFAVSGGRREDCCFALEALSVALEARCANGVAQCRHGIAQRTGGLLGVLCPAVLRKGAGGVAACRFLRRRRPKRCLLFQVFLVALEVGFSGSKKKGKEKRGDALLCRRRLASLHTAATVLNFSLLISLVYISLGSISLNSVFSVYLTKEIRFT